MADLPLLSSPQSPLVDAVVPAPNFTERRGIEEPDMLVLHYTGMVDDDAALRWLTCEESGVSCHYFVHQDGRIVQLVSEDMRAWHAGKSCWKSDRDINSRSIGIEIANRGHEHGYHAFPEAQMLRVAELVSDICDRHSVGPINILAHSDVAPMRKEDPGELFEWERLRVNGMRVQPPAVVQGMGEQCSSKEVAESYHLLETIGYDLQCHEDGERAHGACVKAFQRRYRQASVDGVMDRSTLETMRLVLEAAC